MIKPLKVLIIESHPVFRRGLSEIINQEVTLSVCGEVDNVDKARRAVGKLTPDIVVTGLVFKCQSGLELIRDLKRYYPDVPIMVISMYDESVFAAKAVSSGARGYITKYETPVKIIDALYQVLSGKIYSSSLVEDSIMLKKPGEEFSPLTSDPVAILSNRELEVFQMIGKGLCRITMAETLKVSVKTIGSYRENIKRKLKIKSSPELIKRAVEWNINLT